jgi:hypothetical protein
MTSIWVRSKEDNILFVQGTVFTEVIIHKNHPIEGKFASVIPSFVNPLHITSLSLDGTGNPPPIGLLRRFPNLVNLYFLFVLSEEFAVLRSVFATLNSQLAVSFPRLEFIGLTLRRESPVPYGDKADYAIKDFLKTWIRLYGSVFRTIRVQDEIQPTRWERQMPILKTLVGSFELEHMRSQPQFPAVRLFGGND